MNEWAWVDARMSGSACVVCCACSRRALERRRVRLREEEEDALDRQREQREVGATCTEYSKKIANF